MYQSALGDFATASAEQFYINALRAKTAEERIRIAMELWDIAVEFACADVRRHHPDWSAAQVRGEVARRLLILNGTTRPVAASH
jgi:hypothetical protein